MRIFSGRFATWAATRSTSSPSPTPSQSTSSWWPYPTKKPQLSAKQSLIVGFVDIQCRSRLSQIKVVNFVMNCLPSYTNCCKHRTCTPHPVIRPVTVRQKLQIKQSLSTCEILSEMTHSTGSNIFVLSCSVTTPASTGRSKQLRSSSPSASSRACRHFRVRIYAANSTANQLQPNFIKDFFMQETCLLYTSPSPRDGLLSRMPSSA